MNRNPFTLFALFCAIPGAYLSFKQGFVRDLKEQMMSSDFDESVSWQAKVRLSHKVLAYIYFGRKKKWLEIFNPTSKTSAKLREDKTISLRVFLWFLAAFIFSFWSWFIN